MCVDFTNLNKACPQDPFPLPCIDQIVDSIAEWDLLCFLDAFSGYHQIKMAVEDVEKTTFLTPCGGWISCRGRNAAMKPRFELRGTSRRCGGTTAAASAPGRSRWVTSS